MSEKEEAEEFVAKMNNLLDQQEELLDKLAVVVMQYEQLVAERDSLTPEEITSRLGKLHALADSLDDIHSKQAEE